MSEPHTPASQTPCPEVRTAVASASAGNLLGEGPRMMVVEVVPVWKRHVEASQAAVEVGVVNLLESFANLCDQVSAFSHQAAISDNSANEAAQQRETVLKDTIAAVDVTHQHREKLLAQIASSLAHIDDITHQLQLSAALDDTVSKQQQALVQGRQQLATLAQEVAKDTRQDHQRQDQALLHACEALAQIATQHTEPESARSALQALSVRIEQDLERVLVGLQFQDRLSQMLSSVTTDMQRFIEWMRTHENATYADAMQWLAELEQTYTMQDQLHNHHGSADDTASGNAASSSVEFF